MVTEQPILVKDHTGYQILLCFGHILVPPDTYCNKCYNQSLGVQVKTLSRVNEIGFVGLPNIFKGNTYLRAYDK